MVDDVTTWANKMDTNVKMHGATHKPSTGGSINGLNALEFDGVASTSHENMDAKKNGSTNWNPAGADGAASGTYNDVVLTLLMRANGNGKDENYSAFNLGWAKHWYGWSNK